jgi:hypothetical protein
MERLAATPPAPPKPLALRAAWVVSVILLGGSAAAAVTWRGAVVRAWPASALILGHGIPDGGAASAPHAGSAMPKPATEATGHEK